MNDCSKKLALKIDVSTCRGTREGIPRLIETLQGHNAGASFLFSLGPDQTGRLMKHLFRAGFMSKMSRGGLFSHYGLKTLLNGSLLPAPDIGRNCAGQLKAVKEAGFEVGIQAWSHFQWQDKVREASNAWTENEMDKAIQRFRELFGEFPTFHGAADWQMNRHALRLTQRRDFHFSSDSRGRGPFLPIWNGEPVACLQVPTTLPPLDELLGVEGITEANVAEQLLALSADAPATGHVYTLRAELEGMKLLAVFEQLLQGWQAQGYELVSLGELVGSLDKSALPHCDVSMGSQPGRNEPVLLQRNEFVAA